ncbi:glycosyltransferase [Vacuolonema iberomarrocanum]|uniref:glycosyltransferase n=1 Tax=Vacuolonema iberomarrocanum TaxID=3454632 RepID=UPI003F6E04B9
MMVFTMTVATVETLFTPTRVAMVMNGIGILLAGLVALSLVGMAVITQVYLQSGASPKGAVTLPEWDALSVDEQAHTTPQITILKPLKGLEYELAENLRAFVDLTGPSYEVLFGIADADDPAVSVVKALLADYPEAPLRLIMTTARPGLNPKMLNLQGLEPYIRGELVLVSDANTRPQPDSLKRLAKAFHDPQVGYGCAPFFVRHGQTLGSRLRALHIGSQLVSIIGGVYRLTGIAPIMGKWMVYRRQALQDLGGFAELSHYLAADGLTGQLLSPYGWKGVIIPDLMEISLNHWTVADAWKQLSRWARLMRSLFLFGPLNLLIWNGTFWGLLGLLCLSFGFQPGGIALIGAAIFCWLGLSVIYCWRGGQAFELLLLPLLDWQQITIVIWAYCGNTIAWRDRRFRIGSNARIVDPNHSP